MPSESTSASTSVGQRRRRCRARAAPASDRARGCRSGPRGTSDASAAASVVPHLPRGAQRGAEDHRRRVHRAVDAVGERDRSSEAPPRAARAPGRPTPRRAAVCSVTHRSSRPSAPTQQGQVARHRVVVEHHLRQVGRRPLGGRRRPAGAGRAAAATRRARRRRGRSCSATADAAEHRAERGQLPGRGRPTSTDCVGFALCGHRRRRPAGALAGLADLGLPHHQHVGGDLAAGRTGHGQRGAPAPTHRRPPGVPGRAPATASPSAPRTPTSTAGPRCAVRRRRADRTAERRPAAAGTRAPLDRVVHTGEPAGRPQAERRGQRLLGQGARRPAGTARVAGAARARESASDVEVGLGLAQHVGGDQHQRACRDVLAAWRRGAPSAATSSGTAARSSGDQRDRPGCRRARRPARGRGRRRAAGDRGGAPHRQTAGATPAALSAVSSAASARTIAAPPRRRTVSASTRVPAHAGDEQPDVSRAATSRKTVSSAPWRRTSKRYPPSSAARDQRRRPVGVQRGEQRVVASAGSSSK